MSNMYFLGIFVGGILIVQLELLMILIIYFMFHFLGLMFVGEIIFCALIGILVIGHTLTTIKVIKCVKKDDGFLENELIYRNFRNTLLNNPFLLGVTYRVIKEIYYLKKVACLDFKKEENNK